MYKSALALLIVCIILSGCYRPQITQGVEITQSDLAQVKVGMTKESVIELLGTPVLIQPVNKNELLYVYSSISDHTLNIRRIEITLHGNKVAFISDMHK